MSNMPSTPSGADDAWLARLQSFVGQPTGPARLAGDRVNAPMTRHWCMALGDGNPIYLDEAAARTAGFDGIPAHPTLLQSWTHHDRRFPPPPGTADSAEERLVATLAERGYTSVVATTSDQEYFEYFREGDRITMNGVITGVSPCKTTALGEGHFINSRLDYRDQAGTLKGSLNWTVFRFRPPAASDAAGVLEPPLPPNAGLPPTPVTPLTVAQRVAGAALPSRGIDITPTLITVGAIDSRDFHPVHHDRDKARAGGTRDIIMNVFVTTGLAGVYVTDCLGPGSLLERVAVRLGVPNYPGDHMRLDGKVESVEAMPTGLRVQVALAGMNSLGRHVAATVVARLPAR